ncbi:MAG TPA: nicotinate phosphoribosyltransferase, partial [Albitalea sp.]|nr:nicotinate phosphoribosyltransferase [Albitalea sp.]
SSDAPALDIVYKLQSYAGIARRKRSEAKATWPGAKQVLRRTGNDGRMAGDVVQLDTEPLAGAALLQPRMRGGRRIAPSVTLADARAHHAAQLRALPERLHGLAPATQPYPVDISPALRALAREVDAATR